MLIFAKKEGAARLSKVRSDFEESLSCLNFSSKLWGGFKALIASALHDVANVTAQDKSNVMAKIEQSVVDFFTQVMPMDSFTLRQEAIE